MSRVVIRLPQRGVVDRAVWLRDLVVQRPVEDGRLADGPVRPEHVPAIPELDEQHEDLVGLLARDLDVLALGHLHDLGVLGHLAFELHLDGVLPELLFADVELALEVVLLRLEVFALVRRAGRAVGGGRKADSRGQDDDERSDPEREELFPHVCLLFLTTVKSRRATSPIVRGSRRQVNDGPSPR